MIEDDESTLRALQRLLEAAGLLSAGFESAEQLLASDAYKDAVCVVSDLILPGMSGFLHERVAARTSVERPGEGDGQSLSHGGDRVLDVALGSDRGCLGVLDDGEGQGLRGAGDRREQPHSKCRGGKRLIRHGEGGPRLCRTGA